MLSSLKSRLSYANVVATLALFIALGGSSYAALRVGSGNIVNNSVRSADLRNNDIRSRDIRNRTIVGRDILSNQIRGLQVRESDLAKVPSAANADTLSGLASAEFLRSSRVTGGHSEHHGDTTENLLLSWPEFGVEIYDDGDSDSSAQVVVKNTRPAGQPSLVVASEPGTGTVPAGEKLQLPSAPSTGFADLMVSEREDPHRTLLVQCGFFGGPGSDPDEVSCVGLKSQ